MFVFFASYILRIFVQIFALQFATELLFISLSPFGWQFFLILALKIALNISAKGRLLEKLNLKLDNWFEWAREVVTCIRIVVLGRVRCLVQRSCIPYIPCVR